MSIELKGGDGELTFVVQIQRKETGAVEEYQLTGRITKEQVDTLVQEGVLPQEMKEL